MLPYAILMMNMIWSDGHTLKVRALDPVADGVTFRVASSRKEEWETAPERVCFLFYDRESREYHEVEVRDFTIEKMADEANFALDAVTYAFHTENKEFREALTRLLYEYMDYIQLKQEEDETGLMEALTGLACAEEYPTDSAEWKREFTQGLHQWQPQELLKTELAISLDQPHLWEDFLKMSWPDFLKLYWRENALEGHPLTSLSVTHLYVGNAFCPLLFPEHAILTDIFKKAFVLGLMPVAVCSVMPEHLTDRFREDFACIDAICAETANQGMGDATPEVVVNDLGTALLLREMSLHFRLTQGVLLTKRKKDWRLPWRKASEREERSLFETAVDLLSYRRVLNEEYGITSVSYEACGYPIRISGDADVLHLPLYQTNTAGHCTMVALERYHDRAKQEPVTQCPAYCERDAVLYPKGQPMIGFGNSLFAVSTAEINDPALLNDYIREGIHRLVVRL